MEMLGWFGSGTELTKGCSNSGVIRHDQELPGSLIGWWLLKAKSRSIEVA